MGIFILVGLVCAFIGALIGQSKNRRGDGLILGLFLGVIGLIIVLFLEPRDEERSTGSGTFVKALAIFAALAIVGVMLFQWEERKEAAELAAMYKAKEAEASRPINRATPIPQRSAATVPVPPRRTPDPQAVMADIERKYGTKSTR